MNYFIEPYETTESSQALIPDDNPINARQQIMTPKLTVEKTHLDGLSLVTRLVTTDHRGSFSRLFCETEISVLGNARIKQINHSQTTNCGTVRGLHYQTHPFAETKIITCIRGSIYDVAVDLRANSTTFLQHFSIRLDENSPLSVIIPPGFAHGFQALSEHAEIIYFCTENYSQIHERSINPLDSAISIKWPLTITAVSDKDRNAAFIDSSFTGLLIP